MPDQQFITKIEKGDPITADYLNTVAQAAGLSFSYGSNAIATKEGIWLRDSLRRGFRLGKTNAAITKGLSGTINEYKGQGDGGTETATGGTFEAFSRFTDLDSGKWVLCIRFLSHWEIIVWEC